jgi:rhomboid family GlyGly-CTERM serine protease
MVVPSPLSRVPWWTLGLVAAAILVWAIPGTADFLVYDRVALGEGQWWRLLTAHLVHFSAAHLLNNLAVLAPAAWLAESRSRADARLLLAGSALVIGIVLWAGDPNLAQFGGASGVAIALLVYGALSGLHGRQPWRLICALVLGVTGFKLVAEYYLGWSPTDRMSSADFVPVWQSHFTGLCSGLAMYLWRSYSAIRVRSPILQSRS